MEKLNEIRQYQIGERFTVVDLNTIRIPRTDSKMPLVAQLQPKAIRSVVTEVKPDVPDVEVIRLGDQIQWGLWEKVSLRAETTPYKKGNLYVMSTKRRIFDGVYTNRLGFYLFVHESADQESFKVLLQSITTSIPWLRNGDLSDFIRDQLMA